MTFLASQTGPALHHSGLTLFTRDTYNPNGQSYGLLGDLVGSVVVAVEALVLASPIALAASLAINEYVPYRTRGILTSLVDLLAAVPSLVYGLWGLYFLDGHVFLTTKWLGHHAAFFPPFRDSPNAFGHSLFLAGIVVAIMVLPLMTSITREVMSQTPRENCEAALALGGTRWGMITDVILPFSRNGMVGAAMLGLGRALGETIAVSLVLLGNDHLTSHILHQGGGTVAELIVRQFLGGSPLERSALTVAGLALFTVTLGVNIVARLVVGAAGARRGGA